MPSAKKNVVQVAPVVDNAPIAQSDEEVKDNVSLTVMSEESDEFTKYCDEYLKQLSTEYKEKKNQIRQMMKLHKQSVTNARRNTRKRRSNTQTGFTKPEVVPSGLAKFIGVQEGTEMPRTELTKIVYKKISDRGLFYENDKRVLRADDEILRVFNLSKKVNESTDPHDDNGLNFYNIQRHIARCYKGTEEPQSAPVVAPAQPDAPVQVVNEAPRKQRQPKAAAAAEPKTATDSTPAESKAKPAPRRTKQQSAQAAPAN